MADGEEKAVVVEQLRELLGELTQRLGQLEREAAPGDVSGPRARALAALHERGACCSGGGVEMSSLVEVLDIDQSNVSRLCKKMQRDGEIERRVCERDRRARRLHLTEEGEELARRVATSRRRRLERLLDEMSEVEQLHVLAALKLLNGAIARSGA